MCLADIVRTTGFSAKEIGSCLRKLQAAGKVLATSEKRGRFYWWKQKEAHADD